MQQLKEIVKSTPILFRTYRSVYEWLYRRVWVPFKLWRRKFYQILDRRKDRQKIMVNVGAGVYFRRHWKVLDFPSPHYPYTKLVLDYEFDLTSGEPFPFPDSAVTFFYSSHTVEHLPQENCQAIFNEMYRCLKVGGAVRLTCPDFDRFYEAYQKGDSAFFVKYPGATLEERLLDVLATYFKDKISAEEFQQKAQELSKEALADFYTSQVPRQSQLERTGNHINWWNFDKFQRMLAEAGFTEIYRSEAQGSRFPEMRGGGRQDGFDRSHPEISIFVEAVK